jgi:hypothetical protein
MNTDERISNEMRNDRGPASVDPKVVDQAWTENRRRDMDSDARTTAPFNPTDSAKNDDERWQHIMAEFVDDPRRSVTEAHDLVGQSMQAVIDGLQAERDALQDQWSRGRDVSTETLRLCLQHYRSFFNRLSTRASTNTEEVVDAEIIDERSADPPRSSRHSV